MRKSRRLLFKQKVYGFNPYGDQVPAIKLIMEETGQESEAPVLRMLIDEALRARRQKSSGTDVPKQVTAEQDLTETLKTIQELLLKLIEQGQTMLRIQSLSLELLQETLAEARAARMGSWEHLAVPALRERGRSDEEIAELLERQTEESKDFAYTLAEEIKNDLLAADAEPSTILAEDEDRQRQLFNDDTVGP